MPRLKQRSPGTGTACKRGKTWQARVIVRWTVENGKKRPKRKTKSGFPTRREALAYCDVLLDKKEKQDAFTFMEVYEAWEENYSDRITKSTLNCYRAAKKHFAPVHDMDFGDIDIDNLQGCVDGCGAGKRTREDMKALAGLLYKYAIPRHMATLNVAQYIHTGADDKGTRAAFTDAQIDTIKKASGKVPYADYILALIFTGFRPSELFDLKQDALDPGTMTVTGGAKTEAGKNRPVTISPVVGAIFKARQAIGSEYLFPRADGSQMSAAWFRKACFYPALEAMGMNGQGLSPYSCRHSFANLLKNVAGSDTDKAALMGHTNANMTKYYQSADLVSLKAITDRIDTISDTTSDTICADNVDNKQ